MKYTLTTSQFGRISEFQYRYWSLKEDLVVLHFFNKHSKTMKKTTCNCNTVLASIFNPSFILSHNCDKTYGANVYKRQNHFIHHTKWRKKNIVVTYEYGAPVSIYWTLNSEHTYMQPIDCWYNKHTHKM